MSSYTYYGGPQGPQGPQGGATGAAGGDLSGTYPNPSVVKLQGNSVSNTSPSLNDLLVWNGSQWTPTDVSEIVSSANAIYGSFSDSTDQVLSTGTTLAVQFNTIEGSNGVTVTNNTDPIPRPTRITVSKSGIYSFTISPQLVHTGGGTETVTFWLQKNGINVPRTTSSIEMGNNNNKSLPFIDIILPMSAGQYIEWIFTSVIGTDILIKAFPEVIGPPATPATPSVIAGAVRLGS